MGNDVLADPAGSLGQVLATERRLDALVADARAAAVVTVAAARARAEATEADVTRELADLEAGHRLARDRELEHRRAEVEAAAARSVARFADLGDAESGALAEWLVDRVLAEAPGGIR